MSIGSRIKELRKQKNISRMEFANMLGITVGAVSNYENDFSSPKGTILYRIMDALECEPNYIFQDMVKIKASKNEITFPEYNIVKAYRSLDDAGKRHIVYELNREVQRTEILRSKNASISESETETAANNIPGIEMRLINYYYRLASAGTGQIIFDMPPTKRIEIPNTPEYKKADYAVGVNGNSMYPVYKDGDTLLIEMTDEIEIGEIGIFLVDGESYVKKLGNGELISLNPEFKNITLTESSRCMGKVLGIWDARSNL